MYINSPTLCCRKYTFLVLFRTTSDHIWCKFSIINKEIDTISNAQITHFWCKYGADLYHFLVEIYIDYRIDISIS